MSELKTYKMVDEKYCADCVCVIPSEVYLKSEADKVIAELKQKLENVQASMYADVVDANMKVRMLRRALYKACANWAHHRVFVRFNSNEKAWEAVERRCLKKAEKYK